MLLWRQSPQNKSPRKPEMARRRAYYQIQPSMTQAWKIHRLLGNWHSEWPLRDVCDKRSAGSPRLTDAALMHCLKWGTLNIFRTWKHEGWVANCSLKSLPTIRASSCLAGCSVWTNAHWARDFTYAPHMPTEVSRAPETTNPPPDSLQHQHNKHTHTIPLTDSLP